MSIEVQSHENPGGCVALRISHLHNYMRIVRGLEVKFQEGVFANIHLELDSVIFEFMQIKNNEKIYFFLTIIESRETPMP